MIDSSCRRCRGQLKDRCLTRGLVSGQQARLLPIGQHLPSEAQSRKLDRASCLGPGPQEVEPLGRPRRGAQAGTASRGERGAGGHPYGRALVPWDHAQGRVTAGGRHQELTALPVHVWAIASYWVLRWSASDWSAVLLVRTVMETGWRKWRKEHVTDPRRSTSSDTSETKQWHRKVMDRRI